MLVVRIFAVVGFLILAPNSTSRVSGHAAIVILSMDVESFCPFLARRMQPVEAEVEQAVHLRFVKGSAGESE